MFPDRTGMQTSLSLNKLKPYKKNTTAKYLHNTHMYRRPCAFMCIPHIYALRYITHAMYLDTYMGLPYIPKYTYIQFSDVEVVTNSFALRRKMKYENMLFILCYLSLGADHSLCSSNSKNNSWHPCAWILLGMSTVLFSHTGVPFLTKNPFGHLIRFQNPPPSPFPHFSPFSGLLSVHPLSIHPTSCFFLPLPPLVTCLQRASPCPLVAPGTFSAPLCSLLTCPLSLLMRHLFFPGKSPQPLNRRQSGLQVSGQERAGQAQKQTTGHIDNVFAVLYLPFTR